MELEEVGLPKSPGEFSIDFQGVRPSVSSMGFSGTPKDMGPPYGKLPILFPNPTPMFESLKIWE